MEILEVTRAGKIGIIFAQDKHTGEINTYVGYGEGYDEDQDIVSILEHGQKRPIKYRQELFNRIHLKAWQQQTMTTE